MSQPYPTPTRSLWPAKIAVSCGQYIAAFIAGIFLYFMALIFSRQDYSGFENLICQPFIAVGFSLFFEVIAFILGIPVLLLQPRSRLLRSHLLYAAILLVGLIMFISGFAYDLISAAADMTTVTLLFISGYFLVMFAIVTWPLYVRKRQESNIVIIDQ